MRGVLSLSASVVIVGITMMTVADVQPDQEEIQQVEIVQEAAVKPQEIKAPEARVMARTHDVHVYTQEDASLIKRIALAEGETEGPDGMWLIMSVIVNRVNDPDFPDTVHDVIYQKNCFSSLRDGNFAKAAVTSDECEEAFARIEAGDICPQVVAFEGIQSDVLSEWFMEAFTYRNHKFYTKGGQK